MRLFVDNLTNVDFSYLDARRGMLGETWLASVELEGELDAQGMVCDFGIVKRKLRDWLDATIDHCLLVPAGSPALHHQLSENQCNLQWRLADGLCITCSSPAEAITLVDATSITPESVASWCITQLKPLFPDSIDRLTLRFTPESISGPYYHYSHGLKKHAGNCQRIAHGHRSKIEIWRNGELSIADMERWGREWQDIYIGSEDDLSRGNTDESTLHFAYQAQQGHFSLTMPKDHCYLINTDSTVEFIAAHIAGRLKSETPADTIRVKAYEGLAKGAICEL